MKEDFVGEGLRRGCYILLPSNSSSEAPNLNPEPLNVDIASDHQTTTENDQSRYASPQGSFLQ
jgi:biopolymer transport protein ExbD